METPERRAFHCKSFPIVAACYKIAEKQSHQKHAWLSVQTKIMMTTANNLGKAGANQCSSANSPVAPQDINKAIVNIAKEGDWKTSGTSDKIQLKEFTPLNRVMLSFPQIDCDRLVSPSIRRQNAWLSSPKSNQLSKGRKRKAKRFPTIANIRTRNGQGIRNQNNKKRLLFMKCLVGPSWKSLLEDGVDANSLHRLKST